jgi:hypothetical protein
VGGGGLGNRKAGKLAARRELGRRRRRAHARARARGPGDARACLVVSFPSSSLFFFLVCLGNPIAAALAVTRRETVAASLAPTLSFLPSQAAHANRERSLVSFVPCFFDAGRGGRRPMSMPRHRSRKPISVCPRMDGPAQMRAREARPAQHWPVSFPSSATFF